ncbi:MAG: LLM class flavin-dependent oxidoreductase [Alphaproteobacteria bacterium]|nr:LLM class flavin-dependent oxidoreductase [Alphaproteobacteria bacterium]
MEFGIQFFPDVGPQHKAADVYFNECLALVDLVDRYGYGHVRIVEHYFHYYGGYSPNPMIFLAAAAQRTKTARLVSGAVLPAFNHPLKVAAEIAMVDAISNGRLEAGFARAFLPHEYARFGVDVNTSRARFEEGVEQVRRLLEEERVASQGQFHSSPETTSLPRPTQKPRPPFCVAALSTAESFANAGRLGYSVMAIPMAGGQMRELIGQYREAWRSAGHPGQGRVMLAFHMFCAESQAAATAVARERVNGYLASLVDAAQDWLTGTTSKDYPNYDKLIAGLKAETFESQLAKHAAWVGTPESIREQIHEIDRIVGGFEIASLQVNFNTVPVDDAARSMTLFGERVMPHFRRA